MWGTKDLATGDLEPAFVCLCMGGHRQRGVKCNIKKYSVIKEEDYFMVLNLLQCFLRGNKVRCKKRSKEEVYYSLNMFCMTSLCKLLYFCV